jgi:glycosyltransferase involved in cell wall biosynthesis
MPAANALSVALDVGPLVGPPTGIGRFTADLYQQLQGRPDVSTIPYVLSFRAALPEGSRRLRYPARAALTMWSRTGWPTARGSLRGADVVHGTNYVVPPTGWPTVVSVHDLSLFQRPDLVLPVVRTFGEVIRRAVGHGAFVHTISHAVAKDVRVLLGTDRVRVVYPGPTHNAAQIAGDLPAAVAGHRFLLAIGTREPRKNLPRLVEAFGSVARVHPDCLLVMAGAPGADDAAINRAMASLPDSTATRVLQLGYVDDPTRAALFRHAAAFAYPSLDEGFGLPLLEAMHYGVPIVASTAGAIPEVAAGAALLVDPTDVPGLSAALATVLELPDTRDRLIAAGLVRCKAFSWETAAEQMVQLYREVRDSS